MRTSHAATALAAFTAGLTAAASLRRLAGRRPAVTPAEVNTAVCEVAPVPDHDAIVLPFTHRLLSEPAPRQPASPSRCGESGGRTKAGAPCAARATTGERCHHHRLAA